MLFSAALGVFHISYEVKRLEKDIDVTENKILKEKSTIEVLNAEWVYLNNPGRLERLAGHYLNMNPAKNYQIVHYEEFVKLASAVQEKSDNALFLKIKYD